MIIDTFGHIFTLLFFDICFCSTFSGLLVLCWEGYLFVLKRPNLVVSSFIYFSLIPFSLWIHSEFIHHFYLFTVSL